MNQNPGYNFAPKAPTIPSGQDPRLLALHRSTTKKKKSILPTMAAVLVCLSLLLGSVFWAIQSGYANEYIAKLTSSKNISNFTNTSVTPIQITPSQQVAPTPTTQLVAQTLPSVLSINVQSRGGNTTTAGTGYIVSPDGLVISNKHVVSLGCRFGFDSVQVTALGRDQKAYKLTVQSIDPIDDIAILQIISSSDNTPIENLTPVAFGDSTKVQIGEDVIAIGNALGTFSNTVTKGIVSGLERSFVAGLQDECTNSQVRTDGLIQTDAAINQGNSGGPLFDSVGQLIGMNALGSPDAQNVGLAIPSATILTVLNGYLKNQKIIRPRLGLLSQEIDAIRKLDNPWLPVNYGEFVGSFDSADTSLEVVTPGSSAALAGVKFGDIIIEFDGQKLVSTVNNPSPLRRNILNKQPGESVELTVLKAQRDDVAKTIAYESTPKKIKIKLKGLYYDSPTKKIKIAE